MLSFPKNNVHPYKIIIIGIVLLGGLSSDLCAASIWKSLSGALIPSPWKFTTPMPHGRNAHDSVLGPDGKIYVMGGLVAEVVNEKGSRQEVNGKYSTLVYEPKTKSWTYLDPVPGSLLNIDGKITQFTKKQVLEKKLIPYQENFVGRKDENKIRVYNAKKDKWITLDYEGYSINYNRGNAQKIVQKYFPEYSQDDKWASFDRFYKLRSNKYFYKSPQRGWLLLEDGTLKKNTYYIHDFSKFNNWGSEEEITFDPATKFRDTDLTRKGVGNEIVLSNDGQIYWLGGTSTNANFNDNIVLPFDLNTLQWPKAHSENQLLPEYGPGAHPIKTVYETDIAPNLIARRDHEAMTTPDGKIFVLGGRTRDLQVLDSVEFYDPETNKWEFKKPMPRKIFDFAAVATPDNKIFIFGGSSLKRTYYYSSKGRKGYEDSYPSFNEVSMYDINTDTWSERSSLPEPRVGHTAVLAANGKIYVLGGAKKSRGYTTSYFDSPVKEVFIYDPEKDLWSKGPSMRLPRSLLSSVATPNGEIYAIGGDNLCSFKRPTVGIGPPFMPVPYMDCVGNRYEETVEVLDTN